MHSTVSDQSRRAQRVTGLFFIIAAVLLLAAGPALATIDSTLQMQLGNPTSCTNDSSNHDHYLVTRTVEALDFSDNLGEPRWASWDLTSGDIGGAPRSTSFYVDNTLPTNYYHVKSSDYTGSGYDRGHMCPSEDRSDTTNNNKLVFYMSNIVPQHPDNNQGPWVDFENFCQAQAQTGNEILATCGGSGFDGSTIQPSGKVDIPGYTWKIAVVVPPGAGTAFSRITETTRVVSINVPNIAGIRSNPWTNYNTYANSIQNDTAYGFFSNVSASIAEVLLAKQDGTPAPTISGFSPSSGALGASISIAGANLTGASTVKFYNNVNAAFSVNSSTQIVATVPSGTSDGTIYVITPGGKVTSGSSFTFIPAPTISSFSPTSGVFGASVTITGANFTNASSVMFNGVSSSFTVDSGTQISATVPNGSSSGTISVTTPGGVTTSASSFTVIPAPSISSFSPTNGMAGTAVTITGVNFTDASSVTFNGVSSSFTVDSSTQISATVPNSATTGPISVTTPSGGGTSTVNFAVAKVVVSQVYGAGGNAGASYKNDFIEVYNSGSGDVDLSTYAVQYASATSSNWSKTVLSGTLSAGHYYLVQESSGGTNGLSLPTPQATGTISMAATAGKVALTKTTTLLTVSNPVGLADVVDFVGYGTTANAYEGSGPAPAPSATTSDLRAGSGATDTDNNASDFSTGSVNPRNN